MPDRLRATFEQFGAEWLDLPILHPADPFLETAGEDVRRRMFVTEGASGESLALRPDFTIPVGLEHLRRTNGEGGRPARYAYGGLVFRRHDDGARERLECGFEDIGSEDTALADADIVALAVSGLRSLGLKDLAVRFGDIGLFTSLLEALSLPMAWRQRLRRSYGASARMAENLKSLGRSRTISETKTNSVLNRLAESGDRTGLIGKVEDLLTSHGYLSGHGRTADEIVERFLDKRTLASVELAPEALQVLISFLDMRAPLVSAPTQISQFLESHGLDLGQSVDNFAIRVRLMNERLKNCDVRFDAAFGRPLDYYTGLVFEVALPSTVAASETVIAGGGRYDRLLEMLGAPQSVTAVGFTIDLGRAAEIRA